MAKVISDDEFNETPQIKGAKEIYPYDLWLDGKPREFKQATDFPYISAQSFIASMRGGAKRRGLMIETHVINKTTVRIRAYKPGE